MKKKNTVDLKIPKIIRLPSGSYSTKVMVDGHRHTITRDSYEDCAAEAVAVKYRSKQAEENLRKSKVTLAEAVDQYIAKRRGKRSPSTIKAYGSYRRCRLQSMMKANVFTTTDRQWQAAVDYDFEGLTAKYAKNAWSLFSSAIEEVTGSRPSIMLETVVSEERPFLEPEQILTFVDAIKGTKIEIAALLELSSLRVSEVLDVRGTDVDLDKNRIRVRGAAVYDENGIMVHKRDNKNKTSARYVPIIPPLKSILSSIPLTDDYLVQMSPSWIAEQINRICRANDLPEVGNHGLRHSFASLAYHLQIPELIVMEIGGWSDRGTVHKVYTHLAQRDIAKRSEDFTRYFIK